MLCSVNNTFLGPQSAVRKLDETRSREGEYANGGAAVGGAGAGELVSREGRDLISVSFQFSELVPTTTVLRIALITVLG